VPRSTPVKATPQKRGGQAAGLDPAWSGSRMPKACRLRGKCHLCPTKGNDLRADVTTVLRQRRPSHIGHFARFFGALPLGSGFGGVGCFVRAFSDIGAEDDPSGGRGAVGVAITGAGDEAGGGGGGRSFV
jgi:hypothetical protein